MRCRVWSPSWMIPLAIFGTCNSARAAITLIHPDDNFVKVAVTVDGDDFDTDTPVSLDYTKHLHAGNQIFSDMDVTLTQSAFNFKISQDNPFEIGGTSGYVRLHFHASTNYTYTLSGKFDITGVADGTISTNFAGHLGDDSADKSLFDQDTSKLGTPISIAFGDPGYLGSLTGDIIAGHNYTFGFFAGFFAATDPSGSGTVNLAFTPVATPPGGGGSPVPLPAGLLAGLVGLAPAGFAAKRLRKRA